MTLRSVSDKTNDYGASVEQDGRATSEVRWQEQVSIPICPTQIPHIECNNQNQIIQKYGQLLPV